MACLQELNDELVESYFVGNLSEGESETFEDHLVDCRECQTALEQLVALRDSVIESADSTEGGVLVTFIAQRWVKMAIAAVLIVGLGVTLWMTRSEGERLGRTELAELAWFEPPPYEVPLLRSSGGQAEAHFQQAMELYSAGNYSRALPGLEAASQQDPADATAHFFLGVCYLHTGATEPAIESFRRVVALAPTPYLERARLYLAKALLRAGHVQAARDELEAVVDLAGEMESEALALLERLPR